MWPEELPQQRVYEVLTLPDRPDPFNWRAGYREVSQEVALKNGPRSPIYLGQVQWAWSPMHDRLDAYYLDKEHRHWILWIRHFAGNWYPGACAPHSEASKKQAAVYLLIAFWQAHDCGNFHWINEANYLSVAELQAIAREVWTSGEEESADNDGSDS